VDRTLPSPLTLSVARQLICLKTYQLSHLILRILNRKKPNPLICRGADGEPPLQKVGQLACRNGHEQPHHEIRNNGVLMKMVMEWKEVGKNQMASNLWFWESIWRRRLSARTKPFAGPPKAYLQGG